MRRDSTRRRHHFTFGRFCSTESRDLERDVIPDVSRDHVIMSGVDVVVVTADECRRVIRFLPKYRTSRQRQRQHHDNSLTPSDDFSHVSSYTSSCRLLFLYTAVVHCIACQRYLKLLKKLSNCCDDHCSVQTAGNEYSSIEKQN